MRVIMLKIKDNVDLKELEKYGYVYEQYDSFLGTTEQPHYHKNGKHMSVPYSSIEIDVKTRRIFF